MPTNPIIADKPPIGIYWAKFMRKHRDYSIGATIDDWRLDDEWFIIQFDGKYYEMIGSDEIYDWSNDWDCVSVIGPEIKQPIGV